MPVLKVYNKIDLVPGTRQRIVDDLSPGGDSSFDSHLSNGIYLSAAAGGENAYDALIGLITRTLDGAAKEYSFKFSYNDLKPFNELRKVSVILDTDYREDGIFVIARCGSRSAGRFDRFRIRC